MSDVLVTALSLFAWIIVVVIFAGLLIQVSRCIRDRLLKRRSRVDDDSDFK